MILVSFYQGSGELGMVVEGHAAAAPRGQDLICAAATTLAYTAAQAVQLLHHRGKLGKKPEICLKEGNARIRAAPRSEGTWEVTHSFWVVQAGFLLLEHHYPEHVKVLEALEFAD